MDRPLVSVIVPVFNVGRFLTDSLESIMAQDFRPLEVLVVDDGSTDDSGQVATGVARQHPEIRVQLRRNNMGPASARNLALDIANGEFITFLDADDIMADGRISFQVEYLQAHTDVDVLIGGQEVVVEPGAPLPGWLQQPTDEQPRHYPMSMMFQRSLIDLVGGFDPSMVPGEDADWLYRASAANARFAMVDRVMVYRRIHGQNLTYQAGDLKQAILRSLRDRVNERNQGS